MSKRREAPSDVSLAGEYVLGLLSGARLLLAEQKRRQDRDFARLVDFWETQFAAFLSSVPSKTPPARVKKAIDRRLFESQTATRSVPTWQGLGASIGAIALVVVALLFVTSEDSATYTTTLVPADAGPAIEIAVNPPGAEIRVLPFDYGVPAEKDLELWLLLPDQAPISLGTIRSELDPVRRLPQDIDLTSAQLAVSLEPAGGSPSGAPTGPILATGGLEQKS